MQGPIPVTCFNRYNVMCIYIYEFISLIPRVLAGCLVRFPVYKQAVQRVWLVTKVFRTKTLINQIKLGLDWNSLRERST